MPSPPMPPEALLADYPPPHQAIANRLREVVLNAVPESIERVRTGWRLIGYDLPIGRRRTAMFAWVWLEPEHVHLGFPRGVDMDDPRGAMSGAGITKAARWLTWEPSSSVTEEDAAVATELVLEAARVATLPRMR